MFLALARLLGVAPHTSAAERRHALMNPDIPAFYTLLGAVDRGFVPPKGWFLTTDRTQQYDTHEPRVLLYVHNVLAATFWDDPNPTLPSGHRFSMPCEDPTFRQAVVDILHEAEAFYLARRDHVPHRRLRAHPDRGERTYHSVLDAFVGLHHAA